jgi:hypothetical protein
VSTVAQLPRGHTALLREPEDVPERLRRPVNVRTAEVLAAHPQLAAMAARDDTDEMSEEQQLAALGVLGVMSEINDLAVIAFVADWSFHAEDSDAKLPVTMESLMDLPGDCYDALQKAVAPLYGRMQTKMAAMGPDGVTDPASPTGP